MSKKVERFIILKMQYNDPLADVELSPETLLLMDGTEPRIFATREKAEKFQQDNSISGQVVELPIFIFRQGQS